MDVDQEKASKVNYKYCVVPFCKSTTRVAPEKHFFPLPRNKKARSEWCKLMRRDNLSEQSSLYCCEDHFDFESDIEDFVRYKLMGGRLHLKKNVVPHKFDCQNKKGHLFDKQKTIKKTKQPKSCPSPQTNDVKTLLAEDPMEFVELNKISQIPEKDNSGSQHLDPGDQSDSSVFTDQDEPLASLFVSKQTETFAIRSSSELSYCALCLKEITRFRYVCLVCSQQEWCRECEARGGQHDDHYVLRVPTRRPPDEVDEVQTAIRALASLPIWKKYFPENAEPTIEDMKKVRTKQKAPSKVTTEKKGRSVRNESTDSIDKETECIAEKRVGMNKLSKSIDAPTIKKNPPSRNDIKTTKRRRNETSEVIAETKEAMHKTRTKKPQSKLKARRRSTTKNIPTVDEPSTTTDVLVNEVNELLYQLSKSLNEPRTKKKPLSGKRLKTVINATRNTQSRDKQSENIYESNTVKQESNTAKQESNTAKQDSTESDEEPEVKVEYLIKEEIDPLDEEALQSVPSVRTLDSHVGLSSHVAPPSKRILNDEHMHR